MAAAPLAPTLLLSCLVLLASQCAADLSFVAVGDWGNNAPGEYACAEGMGIVAANISADFSVMLGDNFYSSGIHEPQDGPDGLFRINKTFEEHIPFYAVAGNHDHRGNVSAQIAYSQHYNTRWTYPSWYYGVTKEFTAGGERRTLEILLFDSVQLKGSELPGPAPELRGIAEEQWAWLTARLANSTADYLWVGAHYPVWSV
eukprot:gene18598-59587_t